MYNEDTDESYEHYINLFHGQGVAIRLHSPDDFLKIKETLTRIGVASSTENTLYQSCHILHKRGKYSVCHFKELFTLDGKPSTITTEDIARRNKIADLLEQWNLCDRLFPKEYNDPLAEMSRIKIVKTQDKPDWILKSKYTIGRKTLYNE